MYHCLAASLQTTSTHSLFLSPVSSNLSRPLDQGSSHQGLHNLTTPNRIRTITAAQVKEKDFQVNAKSKMTHNRMAALIKFPQEISPSAEFTSSWQKKTQKPPPLLSTEKSITHSTMCWRRRPLISGLQS